jgi:hypothetical protein
MNFDKNYFKSLNYVNYLEREDKYTKLANELKKFDIRYNTIQHQLNNSECGVYSMNFVIRLALGETFDEITTNITKDPEMNNCRSIYFRNINL